MTRILSSQTLKTLRSSSLTTPTQRTTQSSPRVSPTDSFEAPKKVSSLRNEGDGFDEPGSQVIDLARSVMGQRAHDLKLANDTALGEAMQDGVGDTVNCANFVSGLLTVTGQIPRSERDVSVVGLVANLKEDPNFTQTTLDQAVPGDVVAFEYKKKNGEVGHHVVVFAGRDEQGQPKFIGSDNVNSDNTQSVHESTGVKSGRKVLAVMHYTGAPSVEGVTPSTKGTGSEGLRRGASGPVVRELQQRLGNAGFDPGGVDGAFGPKTEAAVRGFQQAKGLEVNGVVGEDMRALLDEVPAPLTTSKNTATGEELEALALSKHGPQFVQGVKDMAGRLGVKAEWILAVMKNESGMSPTARNPHGGATGLIQFMPSTAKGLGTTTAALSKLSAVEQLKYVEQYYAPFKGKISSGTDLYLATFYPAGVGKADSYGLGGSKVARLNRIFDLDQNGQITAGEFRQYYRQRFPELA